MWFERRGRSNSQDFFLSLELMQQCFPLILSKVLINWLLYKFLILNAYHNFFPHLYLNNLTGGFIWKIPLFLLSMFIPHKCYQTNAYNILDILQLKRKWLKPNISDLLLWSCQHIFRTVLRCFLWTTRKLFKWQDDVERRSNTSL